MDLLVICILLPYWQILGIDTGIRISQFYWKPIVEKMRSVKVAHDDTTTLLESRVLKEKMVVKFIISFASCLHFISSVFKMAVRVNRILLLFYLFSFHKF